MSTRALVVLIVAAVILSNVNTLMSTHALVVLIAATLIVSLYVMYFSPRAWRELDLDIQRQQQRRLDAVPKMSRLQAHAVIRRVLCNETPMDMQYHAALRDHPLAQRRVLAQLQRQRQRQA